MSRLILLPAAAVLLVVGCRDDRLTTEPQTAAPATINASVDVPADAAGASTMCMVNRKALSDLDGQVQANPDNEAVRAEYEIQAAITADICD